MRRVIKFSLISILTTIILICACTHVNAETLVLKVTADKETVVVGDTITVTVNWEQDMQAGDLILSYDSQKLEYQSSTIANEEFINNDSNNKLIVSWVSEDNVSLKQINFTFKASVIGEAIFNVKANGEFASANLIRPNSYDDTTYGTVAINVKEPIKEDDNVFHYNDSQLSTKEFENAKFLNGFNFGQTGTKVEDFIQKIDAETDYDIQIVDKYGSDMSNDKLIGTGSRVLLVNGEEVVDFYTVIYYGDVDGNGTINAIDALAIVKNKNGQIPFVDEIYKEAGRITGESEVPSAVDALAIVKHKTGKYTINQKHENTFKFFPNDYIWAVG